MNPETGELLYITNDIEMTRAKENGFEPIPDHLERAARKKLNGKRLAMVSLTSGGKLSRWAVAKRKKKRQRAKAARKANR